MTKPTGFHRYVGGAFEGDDYLPDDKLVTAVNTAIAAEQPLLVTGEPGTGKTRLAASIAKRLGCGEVLKFVARSDHQARDCLYTFDSLRRLYDAQVNDGRARHPAAYVKLEPLGEAIASGVERVVLIDEIDKAPRDFPNDLLGVLEEKLEFEIRETGQPVTAPPGVRPIVIVTSNHEQPLPGPFLRRCVLHHIEFPADRLADIVRARFTPAQVSAELVGRVVACFNRIREEPLEKKPSIGELLAWVKVLVRYGVAADEVQFKRLADLFPGVLLKVDDDTARVLAAASRGTAGAAGS